jgi:hypothetical protein
MEVVAQLLDVYTETDADMDVDTDADTYTYTDADTDTDTDLCKEDPEFACVLCALLEETVSEAVFSSPCQTDEEEHEEAEPAGPSTPPKGAR